MPMSLRLTPLALILGLAAWGSAQAQNLQELYDAARAYDATYLAARATAEAAGARIGQAEAALRPTLGLNASATQSHTETSANTQLNTRTLSAALQGKYSIYNASNPLNLDRARRAQVAALADFESAEQELMARLASTYFDVLAAQDALATAQASKKFISEQLASAKRNFEVGTATITDTHEAQSRYDLANAQEISAENELRVKRTALDQMVGRVNVEPKRLATPVALPALASDRIDTWLSTAEEQHPSIRRARAGLEVAQLDTQIAKAGEKPTLDATASLSGQNLHNNLAGLAAASSGAGTSKNASIGLSFTYPLYTGGYTQSRLKETLALEERARNDLEFARRSVAQATRQTFSVSQSSRALAKALEAAEASGKLTLEATQLGYKVGVRVNLDVLNAQAQLANTQRDLAKARYDSIVSGLKLRQASGQLRAEDIYAVSGLLAK